MTIDSRPILVRPIEHISIGNDITYTGPSHITIATATYSNLASLASECMGYIFKDFRLTDNLRMEFQAKITTNVSFGNKTLLHAMGWDDSFNVTENQWYTADNISPYLWVPEHQKADQRSFWRASNSYFMGTKAINGNLSGVTLGDVAYSRALKIQAEKSENLGEEFGTTDIEVARCLDRFIRGAVTAYPATRTNPSPRGFWFYPNVNDYIDQCNWSHINTKPEWQDNGGIEFANGDTYVFCHFDDIACSDWRNSPFFGVGHARYNVELYFTTAQKPTGLAAGYYAPQA